MGGIESSEEACANSDRIGQALISPREIGVEFNPDRNPVEGLEVMRRLELKIGGVGWLDRGTHLWQICNCQMGWGGIRAVFPGWP